MSGRRRGQKNGGMRKVHCHHFILLVPRIRGLRFAHKTGVGEEDGIPDVEEEVEEEREEVIHETMFTFEAFEMVIAFVLVACSLLNK